MRKFSSLLSAFLAAAVLLTSSGVHARMGTDKIDKKTKMSAAVDF